LSVSVKSQLLSVRSVAPLLGLLLWWFWPQLAPLLPRRKASPGAIAVLADDPRRTEHALDLWQRRPQATFWVLGSSPLQRATLSLLQRRGLRPDPHRYRMLLAGDDTVGQLTALSRVFPSDEHQLLLITDSAHRDRALTIARQALGARGVRVDAPDKALLPPVDQEETPRRRLRDLLRVQLWRATGWDGRSLGLWLRGARL
jgi:hypothetical protein